MYVYIVILSGLLFQPNHQTRHPKNLGIISRDFQPLEKNKKNITFSDYLKNFSKWKAEHQDSLNAGIQIYQSHERITHCR